MKLLLYTVLTVLQKSLCLVGNVVPIIVAIMGVVVAHRANNDSNVLQGSDLKLQRQAVWPSLQQNVRHVCNVQIVHVVVVTHIVALVGLKYRLEEARQMILAYFRDKLQACVQEALRHVHKCLLPCIAVTESENVEV